MIHRADGAPEPLASDTCQGAEVFQLDGWRRMSSIEMARTIRAAWSAGRRMAWIGLRERHPNASDDDLRVLDAVETLGLELASRLYPDARRIASR